MLAESEANRVNEEMLVAVTAGHDGGDIHEYARVSESGVGLDGVVRVGQSDGSEFAYTPGTSSEEVAMIEALLRQTATNGAAAAAAAAAVAVSAPAVSTAGVATSTVTTSMIKSPDDTGHCHGDDSISGNKLMFCTNCSRSFHQLCHDPVVDDVWAETVAEWLCHDCIQKYGIHFDTDGQELEDARVAAGHLDHDEHSQASESGLTMGEETVKTSSRRMEQAVSGIGISYAQKKNYLNTLPKSVLVDLVLACDATHPDMPLFPASLHVQAAVIGGDAMADYERMAEWTHETAMAATPPARPRGKVTGSADRLPSETTQTGRETVTGLTPRRTYGRRAPRSAVGAPLPSYEDLCVEAVLNMGNENGSLPKRIFEWIATKYPVAANFPCLS
ncbi:hypothetical protein SYNPS1DRAFT_23215 [Syncephalis pseudoplumigaleata]|uniref:PHD-type domain-containing protein n=1 Tax=Syncephalis pseudoplumigaleata TaxID=1712513 RepID=A0A4P9YXC5_9FUNG|nr:hypothetical protein SYNPS1DRAFT_23215 [Syncephalis pseudoplumigaleata]|eukprot:RKP24726.1 hypothetical protein SYNPS1DRAFT_23215 [Syncephalis pseudoplumigaleata]